MPAAALHAVRRAVAAALVLVVAGLAVADTAGAATGDDPARGERLADFDAFCGFVADRYAYFDAARTDWAGACADARQAATDAPDRTALIGVLERVLAELHDPHAHLGTSTPQSRRLVPTDRDLYAEWRGNVAMLVDVRAASGASAAGLRPGMRIIAVDGAAIGDAVTAALPRHGRPGHHAARDWALRAVLAGRQDRRPVRVVVESGGVRSDHAFVPGVVRPDAPLTARSVGTVGVVRIHNTLGDNALIAAFDAALATLHDASALVLDLRDTPSGGNTAVGRGLMSRLVVREAPYQRHERVGEARGTGIRHAWVEYVAPRAAVDGAAPPEPFDRPVVVLVGRWTGSMGEGVAIGLNAARGAPVVGTRMAGLIGGLDTFRLPHAGFEVRIPAERLSHVDGTPREAFVPCPLASPVSDADAALTEAVAFAAVLARDPRWGACPSR